MNERKKAERQQKKMLDWLAKHGKDTSSIKVDQPLFTKPETHDDKFLEGTAVLAYWENGKTWHEKRCTECGQQFASNYGSVGCCSWECLRAAVERIGLTWDPTKTAHERWSKTPPLIVQEDALNLLKELRESPQPVAVSVHDSQSHQSTDDVPEFQDFSLD